MCLQMTDKDRQFERMKEVSKEMKELFLPYELCELAKANGFDDPCFGFYWDKSWKDGKVSDTFHYTVGYKNHNDLVSRVSAPLYDQMLNWFENKRNTILDENLYFSFLEQKWALANSENPDKHNDALSVFFNSRKDALNHLIKDAFREI